LAKLRRSAGDWRPGAGSAGPAIINQKRPRPRRQTLRGPSPFPHRWNAPCVGVAGHETALRGYLASPRDLEWLAVFRETIRAW